MNCPPPLAVLKRDNCEFTAVPCGCPSFSETPCCGSRRCAEHSKKDYLCNCWGSLVNVKQKPGIPERRVKFVKPSRCEVPLRPVNPKCFDCKEGLIICKHRGECGRVAWIACPKCSRLKCEKCLDFICCVCLPDDVGPNLAAAPVVAAPVDAPRVTAAPVADPQVERNMVPVESDRVKSLAAPGVSVVIGKKDQVDYITHRNHVHMNVCDRYSSLADLCKMFGIRKQKASKKERETKKIKRTTIDGSSNPSCSSLASLISSSSSADARSKDLNGLHGGSAEASDAQK